MKTRVVFVNPAYCVEIGDNIRKRGFSDFPLGIGLLATILTQRGYEAEVHNANIHPDWRERTLLAVARGDVAYVGFSCMSSQVESGLELSRQIKEQYPDVPIVWGGVHPSLVPDSLVRTPWVDISVVGEGDTVVEPLVRAVNGEILLRSVPNLVFLDNGEVVKTDRAPETNFDQLPEMVDDRLYGSDIDAYIPRTEPVRKFSILTGLGCRYRCAFCINSVTGRGYRFKPAASIYREIKHLLGTYGVTFFVFQEEHFFGDRDRLFDLLRLIEEDPALFGKIMWITTVRVSDIREGYVDVPLLKRIRQAGCLLLGTGGESGSDRTLKHLRKGTKRADILRAARLCNDAGLTLSFSFVMLWPGETMEDMADTARVMVDVIRSGPFSHVPNFQTYRPYPGSVFEPDLTPYLDPGRLPDDLWRFQFLTKKRTAGYPNPTRVFRLIAVAQVLCLAAEFERAATRRIKRTLARLLFALCRFRIERGWYRFYLEAPVHSSLRRRYVEF
jgi:anaerobic magnesium-protoporphyrin IX monomethyl ester cyclase